MPVHNIHNLSKNDGALFVGIVMHDIAHIIGSCPWIRSDLESKDIIGQFTFYWLLGREIVNHVLHSITWNSMSNGRRKILIDNTARYARKSLLHGKALVTNTSANVNEQGGVRLQTMAKLFLERIDIEKDVLTLPIRGHPKIEVIEARRHAQGPLEGRLFCSVSILESTVVGICRILVFIFYKEFGQSLPAGHNHVVACAVDISTTILPFKLRVPYLW